MVNISDLCDWLSEEGVILFKNSLPFSQNDAKALTIHLTAGDVWGIFMDTDRMKDSAEKKTALLHESGHYATGTTHEVISPVDLIERHEYRADKWAVLHAIPEDELDQAIADGCENIWQLAEHFGVTEDFMRKALCWHIHGNLAVDMYFDMG